MTFRKLINTIHVWLGLASGAILIIVAATGCILAFEDEIRDSTQHGLLYATPVPGQRRLGVDSILNVIHNYDSKAVVTQLRYFGEADKAVQCYTKDKKIYAVDPYAAKVLGYRDQGRDFLFVVLSLHRTLLLGKAGEEIIFWNVWLFLIMLLSGLVLWWPRRLKQIRQAMVIKKNASAKRRNYDLHSVGGFYALVPLLFIAATGINMAWVPAKEPKKKPGVADGIAASPGVYDTAVSLARHGGPVEVLRVTLPKDSTDVLVVSTRYQTNSLRRQTTFAFDQYSAKLLAKDSWERKSFKDRFWGSSYEIHTGRVWGIPGKIIMFLASLVAGSLPVTGFLIWKRKRRKGTTKSGQASLA